MIMKLQNDFFLLEESQSTEHGWIFHISLNPDHLVYIGHFPGQPVTPGVIQMQIVHELLEHQLGRSLQLLRMPVCKFLHVLNPLESPQLIISLDSSPIDRGIKVKATGTFKTTTFFQLRAEYTFE